LKLSLIRSILAVLSDALLEVLSVMFAHDRMPKLEPWLEELITRLEARGEARGEARALIRMLQRRGLALDAADVARITACTDLDALDRWLDRAVTAVTLRDVFDEG
jgi:hypothetical protein